VRLLQVVTTDSRMLDLHPQVSVVSEVDAATRAHLASVVRALARQEAVGHGLVEAHGILFDLEPDLIGLLAPRRADVDPVIRATDLPGVEARDEPLLRARARFADVLERLSAVVATRERIAEELEAVASARAEAEAAVADAVTALEAAEMAVRARDAEEQAATEQAEVRAAQAEAAAHRVAEVSQAAEAAVATAGRERAEAEARVAEASAAVARLGAERAALQLEEQQAAERLDEASEPDLASARAALSAIEADLADAARSHAPVVPEHGDEQQPDLDEPLTRAALVARLAVLDELLAELGALDRAPVEEALDGLRTESPLVPSADAGALADQLEVLDAEIADVEAGGLPEVTAEEVAAATDRLQRAQGAVADAEDAARSHDVDPAEASALEAAHDALHDALERSEARVTGRRARSQVDRLRAEEQAILDRLGFLSFAEYLMGTGAAHRDAAAEAALADARVELAAAEEAADEVEARRGAVLDHAARLDRRRQLLEAAAELVGRPVEDDDDVVAALRDHRVPARSEAVAAGELAGALAGVGLDVDGLDPEDLALVAEAWLEEAAEVDDRRAELAAARAEVEASLAELGPEVGTISPGTPRVAAHGEAAPELGAVTADEVDELRSARDRAVEAVAAAEARVELHEAARATVDAAGADRRLVERALDDAEEAQRAAEVAQREAEEREAQARQALASTMAEAGEPVPASAAEPPGDPIDLPDVDGARAALVAAEARLAASDGAADGVRAEEEATARELAALEAEGEVAARELEVLEEGHAARATSVGSSADAEELEWYLMARIAAQRSVTVAGSAPLLLDDPFGQLEDADVHHLLGRLERMADSVQVIVVSDHPAVGDWAAAVGEARAAVVTPVAV